MLHAAIAAKEIELVNRETELHTKATALTEMLEALENALNSENDAKEQLHNNTNELRDELDKTKLEWWLQLMCLL